MRRRGSWGKHPHMNEAKGVSAADGQHLSDDARGTEIGRLATEVFGHEAETFMSTPRASLGMRSPADATPTVTSTKYARC